MKNAKTRGVVIILVFLLLSGLCLYLTLFGVGSQHKGKASHIRLGLDLAGGVSITYQVKKDNPTDEEMNDTVAKIQQRVEQYSTESNVYKVGTNRIQVEIPGETDANKVLEELGQPGSLTFTLEDGTKVVDGSDIKSAEGNTRNDSTTGQREYVVNIEFNDAGAKKFGDATTANVGKRIIINYDGNVVSSPTVQEPITDGACVIDGMESLDEANQLATYIRIGALPVELQELSSQVVAPQLGSDAVQSSLKAGAVGFGLVCLFMILVYFWPGFMASLALCLYILITMVALNGFNVTLTLPGIAGVILGVGMAVDANVVIFTRIREEIRDGKTIRAAMNSGYHKALSAVLDGNITTLIAAVVLYLKGSGTIRGFAETLVLSIVISMFTALFVTRYLMQSFYDLGVQKVGLYGKAKNTKVVNYVKFSKIAMTCSCIVIIAGLVALPIQKKRTGSALNYDLDFVGGTSMTLTLDKNMSADEADKVVKPIVAKAADISEGSVQIQAVKSASQVVVKTSLLNREQRDAVQDALEKDKNINLKNDIESENISATISKEMRTDAIVAVVIAIILMLIYIWFRFKDWKFGTSAVLALAHDVLVTFCLYSIGRFVVGSNFIAVMLTILGYSINATIIIFDRVRENLKAMSITKDGLATIVNTSIAQTFTRSINTSFTTFLTVFMLCVMGPHSLREFSIALMLGIVVGAYSSVCITSPLWYLFKRGSVKKAEAAAAEKLEKQKKAKEAARLAKEAKQAKQITDSKSNGSGSNAPKNGSSNSGNAQKKPQSTPRKKGGKKKKKKKR